MRALNQLLAPWKRGSREIFVRELIALLFVAVLVVFYVWFIATHLGGMGKG